VQIENLENEAAAEWAKFRWDALMRDQFDSMLRATSSSFFADKLGTRHGCNFDIFIFQFLIFNF